MEKKLTPQQARKKAIKERIAKSNADVAKGLPPDPWVVEFRAKNNVTKAKWKARQPKKEKQPFKRNSSHFKKGEKRPPRSPEQIAISEANNKAYRKAWAEKNKDRLNKRLRDKRRAEPSFKILCNMRKRMSFLVRLYSSKKTTQTLDALGCTMDFFMKHLESQFKEGMSFDNYGQWHLDHIIPCNSFDLTKEEDVRKCFHYTNIQPLWAQENRVKSDKII